MKKGSDSRLIPEHQLAVGSRQLAVRKPHASRLRPHTYFPAIELK